MYMYVMYVYVCISMFVYDKYVNFEVCEHTICTCICMYVHEFLMYVYVCVCMCCLYMYANVNVCIYVCMYAWCLSSFGLNDCHTDMH